MVSDVEGTSSHSGIYSNVNIPGQISFHLVI